MKLYYGIYFLLLLVERTCHASNSNRQIDKPSIKEKYNDSVTVDQFGESFDNLKFSHSSLSSQRMKLKGCAFCSSSTQYVCGVSCCECSAGQYLDGTCGFRSCYGCPGGNDTKILKLFLIQ